MSNDPARYIIWNATRSATRDATWNATSNLSRIRIQNAIKQALEHVK